MVYARRSFLLCAVFLVVLIESRSVNDKACGQNEEYQSCDTQCERTCVDVNKPEKLCNHMCGVGCFCVPGFARQTNENSPCIQETKC